MIARRPTRTKAINMALLLLTKLIPIVEATTAVVVVVLFKGMTRCVTIIVAAT